MQRAVEHTQTEYATVRTGRATPALVEKLKVNYYGVEVPLQQLAGFSVPEARVLVVQPFDRGSMDAISKALMNSDLGINPSNDGEVLRLVFPPLTEERRRDLVRVVKQMAEDGRVAVRNLRRSARQDLDALEKDKEISSDDKERFSKELDRFTQNAVNEIDRALNAKEQELLEI
ncbi:MAG: ribosome recycling factor [Actinomycetota bacterium]|nr:ribosome recycling factor [Acidimicrobiaceae bacterium]MED5540527.1 ribosome recycling factor [Actinomycetota bacterium]MEE2680558.1 ribosome recycling factor [Actinomycetota bacterium]MEE2805738.1 ribosome recycling factor [Actinomycetota bacterium]